MPVQTKIQLRRDTADNWRSTNPTLADGEMGVETVTFKSKIGNGTTLWNDLAYAPAGLADTATTSVNITAGAAGSLPYQSSAGATIFLGIGPAGNILQVVGGVPSWTQPKLNAFASTTSAELSAVISDETGYVTAGDKLVFNNTPALTTPAISLGAGFKGATSGTVTLIAPAAAGNNTITLPLPYSGSSGTLVTSEYSAATYFPIAGGALTGAVTSTTGITTTALMTTGSLKVTGLNGYVFANGSSGNATAVSTIPLDAASAKVSGYLPVTSGGTGGNTPATAQQGLRIFVQPTQPAAGNPVGYVAAANDLWFW